MSTQSVTVNGVAYPLAGITPPIAQNPQIAYMAITPEAARGWLTHNKRNRNHRRRTSIDFGRDIHNGDWVITGDTLKVSRPLLSGEDDDDIPVGGIDFFDGQHRLEAVADGNTAIVTGVAWGLEPEAREFTDSGVRRTFSDVLRMGGKKNANVLAATIKRAAAWESGDTRLNLNYAITKAEGKKFLDAHPEIERSVDIAVRAQGEYKPIRQGVTGLAHWVFSQHGLAEATWFFQRLGDGEEMEKSDPIMQLRKRLLDDRFGDKRIDDRQQLVYYIRTWNARLDGRTNITLYVPKKDDVELPAIKTASA